MKNSEKMLVIGIILPATIFLTGRWFNSIDTPQLTATHLATTTPSETPTPMPDTPTPLPCNTADFITDITIPDGSSFAPNAAFVKTWRIENIGTCTWTTDYDLVFVDGHHMGGPNSAALLENVSPSETVDLSVRISAPQSAKCAAIS